ncbi:hypothetical protein Tco_0012024 [Tanacetum coccineum]
MESQNCPTEINMPKFTDEIGELRAISGHVLRATRIQIPEDDLDNLHSFKEVDGILVFVDPQDLLGFLEYTNLTIGLGDSESRTIGFLEGTSLVVNHLVLEFMQDADPLALSITIPFIQN